MRHLSSPSRRSGGPAGQIDTTPSVVGWAALLAAALAPAALAAAPSASLSVVAPGRVTDLTRAEARLSVRNDSPSAATYDVELFLESTQGRQPLRTVSVSVPAGEQALVSSWFPTAGLGGRNRVGYRVAPATGGDALAGASPLQVVASDTRAVPLISAAWIDPGAVLGSVYPKARPITSADVRDSVDAAQAVGVDTLIITYSEYVLNGWGAFYPSQSLPGPGSGGPAPFDLVGTVLDQASKNGQKVFVGLGRGDDLYLTYDGFNDPGRNAAALAHTGTIASELWELYGDQPSFYGWYLTHEAADIARASASYYNPAVRLLREFSADKPVMVSPSGTPIVSAAALNSSEVDVFAYQDAVGAGYVPYVYTFDPQQRIDTLPQVFASYEAAHEGVDKHLWANLENWQMDGPAYASAYPAASERVLAQLEIEKNYVDTITSYEWLGFMESPDSTAVLGGPAAVDAYVGYRDSYESVRPTLKTVNYVENPGFAVAAGGSWSGSTDRWRPSEGLAEEAISLSTDTPTGTEASLRLDVDQPAPLGWLYQDVPVAEGQEYKFSLWAKALDRGGDGRLAAQVWMLPDPQSGTILDSAALFFESADWAFQSADLTVPAGAGVARVLFAPQTASFAAGMGDYLIDGVSLVGAAGGPGDFNGDASVDAADYGVWLRTFGAALDPRADANNDGLVDAADFTVWRDAFEAANANGSGGTVPEPSGAAIALLGGLVALAGLTRRRRHPAVLAASVAAVLGASGALPAAAQSTAQSTELVPHGLSLSVVPPAAITQQARFEVRAALRNRRPEPASFDVRVQLHPPTGPAVTLLEERRDAPANSQELVSVWREAKGLTGEYRVTCEATPAEGEVLSAEGPLRVVSAEQAALPLLQVGWIEPGAYAGGYPSQRPPDEAYVRAAIDRYDDLGFGALILAYPESIYSGGGVYFPSRTLSGYNRPLGFDAIGAILDQASQNAQRVFVGIGRGADLHLTWTGLDDAQRQRAALSLSQQVATELWALYGHEPSFYGWYLTHEANELERAGEAYYNPLTRFLRTLSADKPVLISPSGTPVVSPAALESLEVDVIAYQDAVGVGYVPYEHTFDPERRIAQLEEVFAAYAEAHRSADKHLWANLELWQMDGPEYRGAYPASFDRVRRQIAIESRYADVLTAYALPGFIEPAGSGVQLGGPRAVRLMDDYTRHAERVLARGTAESPGSERKGD
ncbi:DUF4434 domain-containing protein [Botrimarina sp.]|uniref:DUF4434 domain-containing protein n=1 Tax=Botrimarina sp. TaxID=2795802 RepID=UPI0032ECECBE